MPRHVVALLSALVGFFGLLWVGIVLLKQPAGTSFVVSLVTIMLIGLGITFTSASLTGDDRSERD